MLFALYLETRLTLVWIFMEESASMARVLIKELEPYRPLFIEEPVLDEFMRAIECLLIKPASHWLQVSAFSKYG